MKFDSVMYFRIGLAVTVFMLSVWGWMGQKHALAMKVDDARRTNSDFLAAEGMLDVHLMTWPLTVLPVAILWIMTGGLGILFRAYKKTTYGDASTK